MSIMTIDQKIERATKAAKAHLERGMFFIQLRGKLKMLLPHDVKFLKGQTHEHSALSEGDHVWEIADHGQTRHCVKCFTAQSNCGDPSWHAIPNGTFSREDVEFLVRQDKRIFRENLEEI